METLALAEREAEKEKSAKLLKAEKIVDQLEYNLKMTGRHISQHRHRWE